MFAQASFSDSLSVLLLRTRDAVDSSFSSSFRRGVIGLVLLKGAVGVYTEGYDEFVVDAREPVVAVNEVCDDERSVPAEYPIPYGVVGGTRPGVIGIIVFVGLRGD